MKMITTVITKHGLDKIMKLTWVGFTAKKSMFLGGWVGVKVMLRIDNSNQKIFTDNWLNFVLRMIYFLADALYT